MGDLGYDFTGCHVVVTGGSHGAGLQIARGFREFGATVTVTGRHYLTAYYDADLTAFNYLQLDLADPGSIVEAAARLGPVDVLVNAALPGADGWDGLAEADREFIVQATQLGLIGPRQLAARLRFRLRQSSIVGGGSVIYAPETQHWFKLTHPDSAEAEFSQVTRQLGSTWTRHGVRVNSVTAPASAPVSVPTQSRGLRVNLDNRSGTLLTRAAPPSTSTATGVTDVALFLASRGAAALTGQMLTVRG